MIQLPRTTLAWKLYTQDLLRMTIASTGLAYSLTTTSVHSRKANIKVLDCISPQNRDFVPSDYLRSLSRPIPSHTHHILSPSWPNPRIPRSPTQTPHQRILHLHHHNSQQLNVLNAKNPPRHSSSATNATVYRTVTKIARRLTSRHTRRFVRA